MSEFQGFTRIEKLKLPSFSKSASIEEHWTEGEAGLWTPSRWFVIVFASNEMPQSFGPYASYDAAAKKLNEVLAVTK